MPSFAGPVRRPWPTMTVTLFLRIRKSRPLVCLATMSFLRVEHCRPVQRDLADALDAVFLGVLQVVIDLGIEKKRLGRDAAPVQAGAAQLLRLLDQRDLEAVLPGANRRGVAGGAAANDCYVVNGFCQGMLRSSVAGGGGGAESSAAEPLILCDGKGFMRAGVLGLRPEAGWFPAPRPGFWGRLPDGFRLVSEAETGAGQERFRWRGGLEAARYWKGERVPQSAQDPGGRVPGPSYRPDCDYVDGEVQERNVGEFDHSFLQGLLFRLFFDNRQIWDVRVSPEQRMKLGPSRFRVPDICAMRRAAPREQVITSPPLICIEILSPEDSLQRMRQRTDEYLDFGTKHVWIIDPGLRKGYVCSHGRRFVAVFMLPFVRRLPSSSIPVLARSTVDPSSQLGAALVLLRLLVGVPIGAIAGGWLSQRLGNRLVAASGMAITAAAFLLMTRWTATTLGDPFGPGWLHPSDPVLVACGLGSAWRSPRSTPRCSPRCASRCMDWRRRWWSWRA